MIRVRRSENALQREQREPMSKPVQPGPFDSLSHRWHALAERRRAHFVELYDTGRWKHYYTEEQFLIEMREAVKAAEDWERIAKRAPTAIAADEMVRVLSGDVNSESL